MPPSLLTPQTTPRSETDNDDPDFYYEGPYLVFTEAYHRRRGYCCESGCRHCPYHDDPDQPVGA